MALNFLLAWVLVLLVWKLATRFGDAAFANRAAALVAFFPGAFVLSMSYSEPLMLVLAAGCLLALVDRRWLLAGALAALATATRPNAVALCFACAWAASVAIHQRREWRALLAPVLSPLGALGFFLWLRVHTGHFDAWFKAEEAWTHKADAVQTTGTVVDPAVARALQVGPDWNIVLATAFLGLAVALFYACIKRRQVPVALLVYAVTIIVLTNVPGSIGTRPRQLLTAFPLIIGLAVVLRGRWFIAVLVASGSGLAALAAVTAGGVALIP